MNFVELLAQNSEITYQFSRLGQFSSWWEWLALATTCLVIAVYAVYMYVRDCVELPRAISVGLLLLRLTAFAGILFYYFQLERRFERKIISDSKVILLIDASQSMSIRDGETSDTNPSRMQQVTDGLTNSPLLNSLREQHEVAVYRFDEEQRPLEVALLPKRGQTSSTGADPLVTTSTTNIAAARRFAGAAFFVAIVGLGLVSMYIARVRRGGNEILAWCLPWGLVALIASVVILGTGLLRDPQLTLQRLIDPSDDTPGSASESTSEKPTTSEPTLPDWSATLAPRGAETRIGDALRDILTREQGSSTAACVLVTDGNSNAGIDPRSIMTLARNVRIPVFTVGLGSDVLPLNVRVVDVEAPRRAFAGDKFTVTGHLQLTGSPQASLQVQLLSKPVQSVGETALETIEQEKTIEIAEGTILTQRFEIDVDQQQAGMREFFVRIQSPTGERDKTDNERGTKVEVVNRKERILLIAGGPTRDFIFLRNQIFRDTQHPTHLAVWLQTAKRGVSIEAHEILADFPTDAETLFSFDAIVAFDADWDRLDDLQIDLLERFVGEKAGGLIVVAGPVFTPQWSGQREVGKYRVLKKLLPVSFYGSAAAAGLNRFGSNQAWPLEFSREGEEASFLWLGDDATTSRKNWQSSNGVFGYYTVKDAKPGAVVYARYADPEVKIDNQFPIYMASHFYGAGRVFFLGSGEMWRMRSRDESLFEEFYTKLIRWVSEGRLLRNSGRALLLVDKDRCYLGDRVTIRASLQDRQHQPLQVPEVNASLLTPRGARRTITLKRLRDGNHEGIYVEQFTATEEGDYRIDLAPLEADEEPVAREVRVRLPESELRDVRRNDTLLRQLAEQTSGQYFVGMPAILPSAAAPSPLVSKISPRDQTTFLPSTPDKQFEERLMAWLIGIVAGVLCLEWLLRRLHKLA